MKSVRILWIPFLAFISFNLLFYLFRPADEYLLTFISALLPVICSLLSIAGIVSAVSVLKNYDRSKISWMLILLGMILNMAAEGTYGFLELFLHYDMNEIFPSVADLLWILAYIPIIAGLINFLYGYRKSGLSFGRWKPALIPSLAIFFPLSIITFILVFSPIIKDPETGFFVKSVYLFYPVFDLFIFIPSILLIFLTGQLGKGYYSLPWKYISAGFLLFGLSDIIFSYLSWSSLYKSGNFTDLGWNAAYLLIAIGGFSQRVLVQYLTRAVNRSD